MGYAKTVASAIEVVSRNNTIERCGFSIADAAVYLSTTSSFIRHAVWSGELPAAVLGKKYVIDRLDLDALLEREKRLRTLDSEAA